MNSCASWCSAKEPASQALHTTPPAAPEKPTRCSRAPQLAHAPSWGASPAASSSFSRNESAFAHARAEPVGPGALVEQGELAAEQVEHRRVGLGGLEQPADRVAGPRGAVQGLPVSPQPRVRVQRVGPRHGQQLSPALVELELQPEERLQAPPEAASGAPHALRDRAHPAPVEGVHVEDPVGLPVAHRAQHHCLGSHLSWHILGRV